MKNKLFLGMAFLPLIGLVSMSCANIYPLGGWNLTMKLDKTEARVGDTVTATVVFKNIGSGDMREVELPKWIAAEGGRSKKDILRAVFTTEEDINWADYIPPSQGIDTKAIRFTIKKDEEIRKTFTYIITEEEDLYVHAAAFFKYEDIDEILPVMDENHNMKPEKIKVQQGEQ